MKKTKSKNLLRYCDDQLLKYTLSRMDEDAVYARNTIIQSITGIQVKESKMLDSNLDSETFGEDEIVLNIQVEKNNGRYVIIQILMSFSESTELNRFEFFATKALVNQVEDEDEGYSLKPVHQIIFSSNCICKDKILIDHYQMRNNHGDDESPYPLISRTIVRLPAINEIAKGKPVVEMDDFEQLCYLFENNAEESLLKSKKRLVCVFMEMYEVMQKDEALKLMAILNH